MLALINPLMPDPDEAPRLPLTALSAVVEDATPLPVWAPSAPDAAMAAIGRQVAALLRPGDTLQCGLGRLQATVLEAVMATGLTGLRYHAGMISPPVLAALDRGVFSTVTTGCRPG